ncbi:multifunctional CCA tRNA nucleotidyl transferase/2'3'-cyclic phosphodiesterase/2'nucleotidase/phosphatase, partial [Acinetobacter baumannii]
RFAARFADFTVAPETNALMQRMVQEGEVDALVPERVWQELARGLMEHKPSRMFEVLRACGALQRILPELDALWGVPQPEKWHPEIDTG